MFQNNNAAREIFYIFLWLLGIVLFYTLVHAFLLEPSSNKSKHIKTTNVHIADKKETKSGDTNTVTHTVNPEITHSIKPVIESTSIKVSTEHIEIQKLPKGEMPMTSVPDVPTVPTIPTLFTPITDINSSQVKQPIARNNQTVLIEKKNATQKLLEVAKENATPTVKTTYTREERIQLLETVREDILEQAEKARESAMKGLNP